MSWSSALEIYGAVIIIRIIKKISTSIIIGIREKISVLLLTLSSAITLLMATGRDKVQRVIKRLKVGSINIYIPIPSVPIILVAMILIIIPNNLVNPPPIIRIIVDLINFSFILKIYE